MRKTVQKRIWAIVLTLCMMISLMPSALAASAKDFTDVPPKAWYYGAVDYVAEHGYFNGTDVGKFSPDKPMTRGMFVTVLARVDGVEGNDQANPFEDVPSGMWYSGAVAWAAERGIVLGVGDNRFAPERQVSRQEMAAFIARYLTYYMKEHGVTFQATGTAPAFKDADKIADYAVEAVELCRTYGLVYGDEKGCFVPGSLATRAEAATVIQRLALLLETGEEEPSGGGGGGGGGGTSASASSGTAAGFIQAAQKEADTVTATVETDNSITVNDDIAISNPSVKTLTLDLNNASLGNLTVNSTSATRIEIKGETASVSSLTINAPRATVTNGVAVNGSVNLQAVSNSTFNNTAPHFWQHHRNRTCRGERHAGEPRPRGDRHGEAGDCPRKIRNYQHSGGRRKADSEHGGSGEPHRQQHRRKCDSGRHHGRADHHQRHGGTGYSHGLSA